MSLDSLRDQLATYDVHLFTLSGVSFTVSSALKLMLMVFGLLWLAARLRDLTVNRALQHTHLDTGTRQAVGAVVRYVVIVVGFAIILQNVGLNLGALGVVAGAVSVGVGFGLQNIVSNFVSGMIIMLERPIKVGDRVLLSDIEGEVREIGARRATIVTNDNIAILVAQPALHRRERRQPHVHRHAGAAAPAGERARRARPGAGDRLAAAGRPRAARRAEGPRAPRAAPQPAGRHAELRADRVARPLVQPAAGADQRTQCAHRRPAARAHTPTRIRHPENPT